MPTTGGVACEMSFLENEIAEPVWHHLPCDEATWRLCHATSHTLKKQCEQSGKMAQCEQSWFNSTHAADFANYLREKVVPKPTMRKNGVRFLKAWNEVWVRHFMSLNFYFGEGNPPKSIQYFCQIYMDVEKKNKIRIKVTEIRNPDTGPNNYNLIESRLEEPKYPNNVLLSITTAFFDFMAQGQRSFGDFSAGTPYRDKVSQYKRRLGQRSFGDFSAGTPYRDKVSQYKRRLGLPLIDPLGIRVPLPRSWKPGLTGSFPNHFSRLQRILVPLLQLVLRCLHIQAPEHFKLIAKLV